MKAHVKFTSTLGWSDEQWFQYRLRGVGSSEVAAALGRDRYKPKLRLHLEKCQLWPANMEDSFQTYRGKCLEASIMRDYWRYWTDSKESVLANVSDPEYIPKKYGKVRGFYTNDNYPFLFSTPDAKVPKGLIKVDGTVNPEESLVEAKSIASFYAKTFIIGFPEAYLLQTQHQLLVTSLPYVELMLLMDGTEPAMYGFDCEKTLQGVIVDGTNDFMSNVIETRKFIALKAEATANHRFDELADIEYEIVRREPSPEDTDAYAEFLTERYKNRLLEKKVVGSQGQYDMALRLLKIKEEVKPFESEKKLLENTLKAEMFAQEAVVLDFEGMGTISCREDVNGIRRFRNDIKVIV